MYIFQSSSFKLVCALIVPALIANALPQSLNERRPDENMFLTLYGNKKGDINNRMYAYPEVELTPSKTTAGYDVVGNWQGDENNEKATALRYTTQRSWAQTVYIHRVERKLLAAGYDKEVVQGWWTISRADQ